MCVRAHRSSDGLVLVISSSDCYCSFVTFEPNELGIPLDASVMFSRKAAARESATPTETPPTQTSPPSMELPPPCEPKTIPSDGHIANEVLLSCGLVIPQECSRDSTTKSQRRIKPTLIPSVVPATVLPTPPTGGEPSVETVLPAPSTGGEPSVETVLPTPPTGGEPSVETVLPAPPTGGEPSVEEEMECDGGPVQSPPVPPKNSDDVGQTPTKNPPRRVNFITLSSFKRANPSPTTLQTIEKQ